MKQTAVQWLYETLWKQTDFSLPNNILEKAKEMERKQIIEAYKTSTSQFTNEAEIINHKSAEQYYNEKFNK